jgi:hypothetical protein
VFLAEDGVDYVPGTRGYRRLEPHFVRDQILACRDAELAYLAVHNHGGIGSVGFSDDDFGSHERGYPALLDIGRGVPVGALVLAEEAIAGDLWLPGGERLALDHAKVIGRRVTRYGPGAGRRSAPAAARFDRQARLFGDAGQAILKDLRVGIIGCGGVGMLLVEYLSRLGVGHRWPIAALIATGMLHLIAEAIRPDLRNEFSPAIVGVLLLAYGMWIGWSVTTAGGSIGVAVAAGAVVGILPLALDVVGFGVLLGRGVDAGLTAGVFGFLIVVFGALAGSAFGASRAATAAV